MACFVAGVFFVFLLSGCGKKKEEPSTETGPSYGQDYKELSAVSGVTFYVRAEDLSGDISYNPSLLNDTDCPLYYWTEEWFEPDGTVKTYESKPIDRSVTVVQNMEDRYSLTGSGFVYDVGYNGAFGCSLSVVENAEDFAAVFSGIPIAAITDVRSAEDGRFVKTEENGIIRAEARITFSQWGETSMSGVLVMTETDLGQSYYVCGGVDFTDEELDALSSGFSLSPDTRTDMLVHYPDAAVSYDLGGKRIDGTFSSLFGIRTDIPSYYIYRYGFPELFSANPYARLSTLFGVYCVPQGGADMFLGAYSSIYRLEMAEQKDSITDADGRTWNKYYYPYSEVPTLSQTLLYVCSEGNYIYLFALYFEPDGSLPTEELMDRAVSSVHITQGTSLPYDGPSDYFYSAYGVPAPQAVPATPTDAAPEPPAQEATETAPEETPETVPETAGGAEDSQPAAQEPSTQEGAMDFQ